jgi:hypothetical protein
MLPVLVIIVAISLLTALGFRWFERYRYTDRWRTSEFRGVAFSFLMWFGGIFGHRVPPPPQAKVEFATRTDGLGASDADPPASDGSGGAALADHAADDEQ